MAWNVTVTKPLEDGKSIQRQEDVTIFFFMSFHPYSTNYMCNWCSDFLKASLLWYGLSDGFACGLLWNILLYSLCKNYHIKTKEICMLSVCGAFYRIKTSQSKPGDRQKDKSFLHKWKLFLRCDISNTLLHLRLKTFKNALSFNTHHTTTVPNCSGLCGDLVLLGAVLLFLKLI